MTRRAVPIEMTRLEPAAVAAVQGEAARVLVYQIADQFQIAAPLERCFQQLRFEELVEAEQGRRFAQLVAHQLVGAPGPVSLQDRLEYGVEHVERWIACQVPAQQV